MNYLPPKCNCGKKLDFYRQHITERFHAITDKGYVGRVKKKNEGLLDEPPYLSCECGSRYRLLLDDENRFVRGEIYR